MKVIPSSSIPIQVNFQKSPHLLDTAPPRKPFDSTNIETIVMRDRNMWAYIGASEAIHTKPIEYVKETLGLELPENWREYTYEERNAWVDENVGEEKIRAYNLILWEREIDLIIESLSSYKKSK